jgi:hypothetical protein
VRVRGAVLIVIAGVGAACHAPAPPAPTTGAIVGQVRDQDTGTTLARAQIAVREDGALQPALATTGDDGGYAIDRLRPGRYDVTASYAGVTLDVSAVTVVAGHATAVDLDLALGRPEAHHLDFGDPHAGDIRIYRPPHADPAKGALEGTVTDAATHERVPGAVVTATSPAMPQAVQVVTDAAASRSPTCLPASTRSARTTRSRITARSRSSTTSSTWKAARPRWFRCSSKLSSSPAATRVVRPSPGLVEALTHRGGDWRSR